VALHKKFIEAGKSLPRLRHRCHAEWLGSDGYAPRRLAGRTPGAQDWAALGFDKL